jgi:hypothetical protein
MYYSSDDVAKLVKDMSKIGICTYLRKTLYQDAKLNTLVESNVRPHYFHKTNMLMVLLPVAKEI